MALFYGDVQVSDAVDADAEGVYTLEYDTASGGVPVGSAVTSDGALRCFGQHGRSERSH